ncbi:GNAT family N-acetyltransferase [Nocardioides sp. JQ2195]|uniref:GNAT family N-acetyltransferase n=1 Tax=Nocardioides sp. JQ2195 TaxID=2592334 RepID=UPI00143E5F33|nr:GNAT family N-acetyltransferase [Nocardioides sp. JQ2195]QIX28380.1 GNAT family N-acetyltransferase [Nocardioides sp. JQ2195]
MELPPGLTTRALSFDDAQSVTDAMAADEVAATGEAAIELADIVSDWRRPSFDLATSTIGVFESGRLLGYAELGGHDRADAAVHPDHHGRGVGTWLAHWVVATARSRGASVVGMPVPQGSTADTLLATLGFRVRWSSWILELPTGSAIPPRPLPEGHTIRAATDEDHRAAWTVVEDAFLEWSDRERDPFEDFLAKVVQRPGFRPWHLRVAVDPAGSVVGVSSLVMAQQCAFVERLAVRRDVRGRGLAQALLADSFTQARAHGADRCELSTDSRTGALSLYEKVGMVVTSTWVNRAIDL